MLLIGVPQVAAMTIQHHDTNTKIDTSYTCVFMRAISYTDGTVCAINDAAEPTYQPVSNVSDQTPRLLNDEHVGDAYITSDETMTLYGGKAYGAEIYRHDAGGTALEGLLVPAVLAGRLAFKAQGLIGGVLRLACDLLAGVCTSINLLTLAVATGVAIGCYPEGFLGGSLLGAADLLRGVDASTGGVDLQELRAGVQEMVFALPLLERRRV